MLGIQEFPQLKHLPKALPLDNVVRIELQEGIPIFRASAWLQKRIQTLLDKKQEGSLTTNENRELDSYEEIDDYLSLVNRIVRNLSLTKPSQLLNASKTL